MYCDYMYLKKGLTFHEHGTIAHQRTAFFSESLLNSFKSVCQRIYNVRSDSGRTCLVYLI